MAKMYEKILVPLDGSELAERALPYVEELAKKLKSQVILLTACMPDECMERPLTAYLEKMAEKFRSSKIKVRPIVVQGDAANVILDFAQKNSIGLITISSHGSSGISRWAFGSIVNKVLQKSHIPVLLIRSKELEAGIAEKEIKKILILLDGSQFAESIIPYVEGMTKGLDEVILLRVIESIEVPHFIYYDLLLPGWEKYDEDIKAGAEKEARYYLNKHKSSLRNKGIKVSTAWLHGIPINTILQYAEDNSVDLIAMSTHGSSGVSEWAYGSIATKIIEASSKPFLLVRPLLTALQEEQPVVRCPKESMVIEVFTKH